MHGIAIKTVLKLPILYPSVEFFLRLNICKFCKEDGLYMVRLCSLIFNHNHTCRKFKD